MKFIDILTFEYMLLAFTLQQVLYHFWFKWRRRKSVIDFQFLYTYTHSHTHTMWMGNYSIQLILCEMFKFSLHTFNVIYAYPFLYPFQKSKRKKQLNIARTIWDIVFILMQVMRFFLHLFFFFNVNSQTHSQSHDHMHCFDLLSSMVVQI